MRLNFRLYYQFPSQIVTRFLYNTGLSTKDPAKRSSLRHALKGGTLQQTTAPGPEAKGQFTKWQ
jgi:hypothetical protein